MGNDQEQRILVVDDNEVNCELLRTLLGSRGYTVFDERSALAATARALDLKPHLVLLDVMMPDRNGFEVCRDMKAAFAPDFVPIILLTALEDVDSLEKGLDAGADDYVSKPFEPRVLLARVRSSLRSKGLWDELVQTQQKLIDAEKMAAIGDMTVTLKHEINNPLQTIIGYADYLLSTLPEHSELYPQIEAICKGGERIAQLLAKLDQVRRHATTPYLGDDRMLDLDRAAGDSLPD